MRPNWPPPTMPSHAPGKIGDTGVLSGFILVVGHGRCEYRTRPVDALDIYEYCACRNRTANASRQCYSGGSVMACAAWFCRTRNAASFSAYSGDVPLNSDTANSAAFAAPASPIANVATGTPFGICTIECSESTPFRYLLATGTPSTGTVVFAASMPGRCAAPPAPAMIARRPRSRALCAYANISSGIRWAETTFASYGTPNS